MQLQNKWHNSVSYIFIFLLFFSHRDDNLSSLIPRRHSDIVHSSRAQSTRKISLEDPDSPVLVIRSNMKSSKVKTAVKRSEKANDDLFELWFFISLIYIKFFSLSFAFFLKTCQAILMAWSSLYYLRLARTSFSPF